MGRPLFSTIFLAARATAVTSSTCDDGGGLGAGLGILVRCVQAGIERCRRETTALFQVVFVVEQLLRNA